MRILLSHPTGNENSRQAARALAELAALATFATSLYLCSEGIPWRWLPGRLQSEVARRDFSMVGGRIQSVAAVREFARLAASRIGLQRLIARESSWASIDSLYKAVDQTVARMVEKNDSLTAVYAYDGCARQTFNAARDQGLARLYEIPIGYWRAHERLVQEEAELKPDWAHTWTSGNISQSVYEQKDDELVLASKVIVPSTFVARTLGAYPGGTESLRIDVIPYGIPTPIEATQRRWYAGGTLKVLFVGGLSQRKGLSYLLEALSPLGKKVELTLIGIGPGAAQVEATGARLLGSLPRPMVLEMMRQCDVMVFPTLFEGLALVIGEAMSQGLPVITTAHSGAETLIERGVDGWIVPIRDADAITAILGDCIQKPALVEAVGTAALKKAGAWQWRDYRKRLQQLVCEEAPALQTRAAS